MALIQEETSARRLARAILADIELYNGEAIAAGKDLSEPIEEGRGLYQTRVVPRWHRLFEDELAQRPFGRTAPLARTTKKEPTFDHRSAPIVSDVNRDRAPGSNPIVWLVALAVIGAGLWFFLRTR